jgi:hypothetical protein
MASAIARVLEIMKALKSLATTDPIIKLFETWGVKRDDQLLVARLRAFVIEEALQAEGELEVPPLKDSGLEAMLPMLQDFRALFAGDIFSTQVQNFRALDATIGALAFAVKTARLAPPPRPPAVLELLQAVEEMIASFSEADIDVRLKKTALRHLHLLAALLHQVEIFGVEAAQAAYTELVVRLQSSLRSQADSQRKPVQLLDRIRKWSGLLKDMDEAYEHGEKLLGHVSEVVGLLE